MSTEENKAVVRRSVEQVFNGDDFEVAAELMDENLVDHRPFPGQPPGLKGILWKFSATRSAFPDIHMTILDLIGEGDKVVAFMENGGTQEGEFMGVPPTGKTASWNGVAIFRLESGRIVEHWAVVDQLDMMRQLGLLPPGGGR